MDLFETNNASVPIEMETSEVYKLPICPNPLTLCEICGKFIPGTNFSCKECSLTMIEKKSGDDQPTATHEELQAEDSTDYVEFVKIIFPSENEEVEKEVNDSELEIVEEKREKMHDLVIEKDVSDKTNGESSLLCPYCKHELPWIGESITVKLEECEHTLCRWCMTELIQTIIKDGTTGPRCPCVFSDLHVTCNSMIQEHEIRELVEPTLYETYLEKSIIKIKEDAGNRIVHCKTSTCQAWYIMEDDNVNTFLCTLCNVNNYIDEMDDQNPEEPLTDLDSFILNERYNEILQLSESCIVPNFESFECPICFVQYKPREGVILKNCLHTFCKACIANVVIYSEDAEIKCPYKNDDYSCDEMMLQSEIKALVEPADFDKYLKKSIAQAELKAGKSAYHCKTPNCPDWCFYEAGVDHFLCPTCKEDNCFLCQKIHTGKGCIDSTSTDPDAISQQSEAAIEIMLRNGNALRCPTCKAVITKAEGCDALTCAGCKTEICWVTRGPRWGPGGRGDTSGGCKCTLNKRCHPLCRNCH